MRYADPTRCPDCRDELPAGVPVCPTCRLLVRHPLAVDLFSTLRRADDLVEDLRTASDAFPGPALSASATAAPLGGALVPPGAPVTPKRSVPTPPASMPATPAASSSGYASSTGPVDPSRTGVSVSSIPKILLGLGAFCLLTAGVIFLAVSWSALGVGGRTGVLLAFTAASLSSSMLLHARGLRIAGESLSIVGLGMLCLDVLGAGAAGWLGDGSRGWTASCAGLLVAVAGSALGLLRIGSQPRLTSPQVLAGAGLATAYLGAVAASGHDLLVAHVATVLALAVAWVGHRATEDALLRSAAIAALLTWSGGAIVALVQGLLDPTLVQLWRDGTGWSLIASAAWMALPGLVLRERRLALLGAAGAAVVVTVTATLPGIDGELTSIGMLALVVTSAWLVALAALPAAVRVVAVAPACAGAAILAGISLSTMSVAFVRWTDFLAENPAAFDRSIGLRLSGPDAPASPLQLVPSLLVIAAVVALLGRGRIGRSAVAAGAALVTGVGAAVTLMSYDVALALPVGALVLTAAGCLSVALRGSGAAATGSGVLGLALAAIATATALPSAPLAALTAGAAAVGAITLARLRDDALRALGGLAAAPFVGLAIAATVHVTDAGGAWVAVPVLLGVGILALALPRTEVEMAAGVTALFALATSLPHVQDAGGFSSLWLCVAGFLCCASALLTPARRPLGGVGLALLLLATWVRLIDLSVRQPEAYTLPLALALLALGLWRLQRSDETSTVTALLPGLLLVTVPSLLWVLSDPISLRALVLGASCLILTIAGAALRWNAPLLTGAVVGTIVILREIGPYAGAVPQWVWIALAGAVLTGLGITWERRVIEVRRTVGFLGRLR
ncbi:SCO7613 C-terminal domain-containing membrane protein [Nocardioides caeni]|uniref:DUF2157 domain-containing protein n=1 Tax=Nocardioides caeni TaxID=574700 RepID=A0A4V4HLH3_9ACTN|nr:hypothetical protein [Nocardioides caeni]THV18276.1 hypothetical protein E9934_01140 [Nocardioides caeni]